MLVWRRLLSGAGWAVPQEGVTKGVVFGNSWDRTLCRVGWGGSRQSTSYPVSLTLPWNACASSHVNLCNSWRTSLYFIFLLTSPALRHCICPLPSFYLKDQEVARQQNRGLSSNSLWEIRDRTALHQHVWQRAKLKTPALSNSHLDWSQDCRKQRRETVFPS